MNLLRILSIVVLALSSLTAYASVTDYRFKVLLDDKEIGQHSFTFKPSSPDGDYQLVSIASYDVKILFINAYQYRHRSEERWADGCLQGIKSTTDDNGDDFQVVGQKNTKGMALNVNGRPQPTDSQCVRTFSYWAPELLDAGQLLNSQTGELEPVGFTEKGKQLLPWAPTLSANNIELATKNGNIQLWYGDDGRWLGLRTKMTNGRVLQYQPLPDGSNLINAAGEDNR